MKKRGAFREFFIMLVVAAVLLSPVALAGSAFATEGGGGAYPNGAEDFMAGALPPPGTYFKNYLTYYTASAFKDNKGHDLIPDFKLKVVADVLRFVHVTNYKFLGADWAVQAVIPVVYQDVTLGGRSDDRFGLGDIIVDPIVLGWHSKNFHITAGLDIYIPVGAYSEDRLANPGRNYWTFEPVLGITYLSNGGFELSAKFMYDFNTENDDTNYESGQEFHFDYTIGYHVNKQWAVGIGGYYYCQRTEDEKNGIKQGPGGFEGRVFSIGPVVRYAYKNMSFALKWQPEFEARNRPEGDKFWFNLVYAF
ncbi:MAG TPA: hypothetical protein DDY17_03170 [Syntrophaceae bacterium]|jgi:hypothetical protein|nr:hypothetical protein [Syntrophaceae bacterium]